MEVAEDDSSLLESETCGGRWVPGEVNLLEKVLPSLKNKSLEFQGLPTKYQQEYLRNTSWEIR